MLMRGTPITIRYGDRIFGGFYATQSDMLTVWNRDFGSRSVQLEGRTATDVARGLLLELVQGCSVDVLRRTMRAA